MNKYYLNLPFTFTGSFIENKIKVSELDIAFLRLRARNNRNAQRLQPRSPGYGEVTLPATLSMLVEARWSYVHRSLAEVISRR
jgi:hypothetical protein